jgi:hypothetical protein
MTVILDRGKLVVHIFGLDEPDENRYGYTEELKACSDAELVESINKEVGIPHWGYGRGDYLGHLYIEFRSRDLDCSSFIKDNTMCIAKPFRLEGKKILI